MFIQQEAAAKGCQQVLWLFGEEEQITEVGAMNLFMFWTNEQGGKLKRNQHLTSSFKLHWLLNKDIHFHSTSTIAHDAIIIVPVCDLRNQELCDQNLRKVTAIKSLVLLLYQYIQCGICLKKKWYRLF